MPMRTRKVFVYTDGRMHCGTYTVEHRVVTVFYREESISARAGRMSLPVLARLLLLDMITNRTRLVPWSQPPDCGCFVVDRRIMTVSKGMDSRTAPVGDATILVLARLLLRMPMEARREERREAARQSQRKYYAANREAINARRAKAYKRNRAAIKEGRKER